MSPFNRRSFLAAGAAGLTARAASASDSIVLGVMGVHGRGKQLAEVFAQNPDVRIAYICDPDQRVWGPCVDVVTRLNGVTPRAICDFREILEDKAVDGLVIAAPDHWHALATIHACQAGKHVYVEKPISHNLVEGRRMVEAARKNRRVVQVGTQRRSSSTLAEMVDYVRAGKIGKVSFCRTWITSQRPNIGFAADEPAPAGVEYDLWLGPAPKRTFNKNHFHYNWHWLWQYGTGELGNNGIHAVDVARWALDIGYPRSVVSSGGKFVFDDDQATPDTQLVCFEYPDLILTWEHRIWSPHGVEIHNWKFGIAFYGDKGTVLTDGETWKVCELGDEPKRVASKPSRNDGVHQRNWLDCIKSGRLPNADIEIGHVSTALCHLGNIAQRVGRRIHWDGAKETFAKPDPDAAALLSREYRSPWELPRV